MKKLLIICLLPILSFAEQTIDKPVVCDKTEKILSTLMGNKYQETPLWAGIDENSKYGLLTNRETGTWTFIQFNKEIACVLGVGESSRILNSGKRV
jgi:hypothetical protein